MNEFSALGLAEPILKALAAKRYGAPTPIQAQAIPALLEGRDLLGIAQTGTGKTAAFALPALDWLVREPKPRMARSCRVLVLAPTRELAAQIAQSFRDYARFVPMRVEAIFGGVPVGRQIGKLADGVDVLVATPGRLLDLIDQRALTLANVDVFVLDEADQMMDLGFVHALKRVTKLLPKDRQSLFFSATMPPAIDELARAFITDPVRVEIAPQSTTAERVRQQVIFVERAEKQALLTISLLDEPLDRALIFTRTKHGADKVVRHLMGANIGARAIHGNKSQAQRTAALQAFRSGEVRYLVATDIAARGIDIPGVSHVINLDLPEVPEQYVHRIGRTARAGTDGVAISYVSPDERPLLKAIERAARIKPEARPLPADFVRRSVDLPKPAAVERAAPPPRPRSGGRPKPNGAPRADDASRAGRPPARRAAKAAVRPTHPPRGRG